MPKSMMRSYVQSLKVLFIQNYNYSKTLLTHTWSLAVEEHFYLILAFVFFLFARLKILDNKFLFNILTICILLSCMYMRYALVFSTPDFPYFTRYLFPTHLRFDTLWLGTFIAFHYNYSPSVFKRIFTGKKWLLFGLIAFIIPLISPLDTSFLAIFGLPLIALAFGITLATLIADDSNEVFLNTLLGKRTVYLLAKIGTCSYAIYLFHVMIIVIVKPFTPNLWVRSFNTLFVFFATIIVGIVATELIEKPILTWRNKHIK